MASKFPWRNPKTRPGSKSAYAFPLLDAHSVAGLGESGQHFDVLGGLFIRL
jgi:hypothetical protein